MSWLTIAALTLGGMALIYIGTLIRACIQDDRDEAMGEALARASEHAKPFSGYRTGDAITVTGTWLGATCEVTVTETEERPHGAL
jgi:hypothetical protein